MKRLYFILTALIVASVVLAACGSTPTEAPATEAPATEAPATEAPATEAPVAGVPEICSTDAIGCAVIEPGQTIKIGMGAPLTGDYAAFGIDISQAAKIAISDAGELDGFTFELVAEDDGGSPEGGAAVANKLVSDPTVVAVAGHIFSGATEAAMPIYEAAGIPMMSPSATRADLTEKGSAVFNRVPFIDSVQAAYAADYLYNNLNIRKLAILHDGSSYGQGLAEGVQSAFTAAGGEVVSLQAINPGESDYSAVLTDIASKSPEALYFGGYYSEAIVLVNQMKQAGLTNAIFFSDDGTFGQDILDRAAANSEGIVYATSAVPAASEAKTIFDDAYRAAYGTEPGKLSTFTWTAYDSASVLVSAIKSVAVLGGDGNLYIPRATLVAAVRGTKDFPGITGMLTCSDTGECGSSGPSFFVVQGGQWVEAPN